METTDQPKKSSAPLTSTGGIKESTSLPDSPHETSLTGKSSGITSEINAGDSKTIQVSEGPSSIGGSDVGESINQQANHGKGSLLPNAEK